MIETFFGLGQLDSPAGYFAALVLGLCFGFCLERAGFGSSRRLAGIFYFTDMAVLKVMFSAMITAMLGLAYCLALGWIEPGSLYFMPTVYGAQVVGGLLFGVGFVMSGWCPGTGAVGAASGKLDALVFLGGALVGSILFNELFPVIKPLYAWGESGVLFVYDSLGASKPAFVLVLTVVAVGCFWGAEAVEKKRVGGGHYLNSPFLKTFSAVLVFLAAALFILPSAPGNLAGASAGESGAGRAGAALPARETSLLQQIESAGDHMDPVELADRLMSGEQGLQVIDLRTPDEFKAFHIRGAVNVPLSQLPDYLAPTRNEGIVVLYSNGMTHPAQARDALSRLGFENVYILTDGLQGFMDACLKPASLRSEPLPAEMVSRIDRWRRYFTSPAETAKAGAETLPPLPAVPLPGIIPTDWLGENLGKNGIRVIDVRSQPEYNTAHIPGSIYLSVDSFRGVVGGLPSMLLPAEMLALHLSHMGITPSDLVVVVPGGDKTQDATLVGMAFERLGHKRYGILGGGFGKWVAEKRPLDNRLPQITPSHYPPVGNSDTFTVDYRAVLKVVREGGGIILDVRPADYFSGKKSDEARGGHIPGAINRPFTEDIRKNESFSAFKPVDELAAAYEKLIPTKATKVIVHCRTGHQASQTFFVLKNLLGYTHVLYYDAGWTEWAARPELPVK